MGASEVGPLGTPRGSGAPSSTVDDARDVELREIVRRLNGSLGATLVAALAGASDAMTAREWARHDGPEPGLDASKRLRFAHDAWRMVAEAEGEAVARAWFTGANPWLDDDTAINAIRVGRLEAVASAACALTQDSHNG
ncbi:hypothetical protein [Brachybacterium sp. ACRRE]|uniref:hypothetical protein n=1 Tax=Brachybacterium sp. ACRRE TaxID=2918184 RepID=UPI001EF17EC6|nr:hypothetical protein [Brachybacterium sp. ACRRE]MCG7308334.1 hypothetical protein [Brachybacterium sp. ACRRE]